MARWCNFLYKVEILCKYHVDSTSQSWSHGNSECQQRSLNFKVHLSSQDLKLSPTNGWIIGKYL